MTLCVDWTNICLLTYTKHETELLTSQLNPNTTANQVIIRTNCSYDLRKDQINNRQELPAYQVLKKSSCESFALM
ncbi:hypothetical protein ACTXT7_001442 [Hymenolepis weldensis]